MNRALQPPSTGRRARVVDGWKVVSLALALLSVGHLCGCASDAGQIQHRTAALMQNLQGGNATAVVNDLPPEQRSADCKRKVQEFADAVRQRGLHFKAPKTVVKRIDGNSATADVSISWETASPRASQAYTSAWHYIKSGGNWYVDGRGGPEDEDVCSS